MKMKKPSTFTAKWTDTNKVVYRNKPHGNLFGMLPYGSMPSKFPGRLADDTGEWDEWDGAEFVCEGRTIKIEKD
jgi:hypothetical protein